MGTLTPLGNTVEAFWEGLVNGKSGIGEITRFDTTDFTSKIAGEVRDFEPTDYVSRRDARRMDRFTQFAVAAADTALEAAGLDTCSWNGERVGVVLGSGIGGMETFEDQHRVLMKKGPKRVSPFFVPMMIANMAAGQIAIRFDARGPNTTVVTACASAASAIGEAYRVLRDNDADIVVAGGSEAAVVPLAVAGFCSARALSTRNDDPEAASRPFDADRDGFVMGEGAGILVLERLEHAVERNAPILAELAGYGASADAYHITSPPPDGAGGARSMRAALSDASLNPDDIGYINAHGTSTPPGDAAETEAIKSVFGEGAYQVPVSANKSMTGHLLGAAGAVELIACILSLQEGVIPPTINLTEPDPECDLDYVPGQAREFTGDYVLSNSFGFGGQNATLIVGRYE
jgi:3-oxoacyl-[acyl-carrier-protein] synthase II